jgi:hypothetical protein
MWNAAQYREFEEPVGGKNDVSRNTAAYYSRAGLFTIKSAPDYHRELS